MKMKPNMWTLLTIYWEKWRDNTKKGFPLKNSEEAVKSSLKWARKDLSTINSDSESNGFFLGWEFRNEIWNLTI